MISNNDNRNDNKFFFNWELNFLFLLLFINYFVETKLVNQKNKNIKREFLIK